MDRDKDIKERIQALYAKYDGIYGYRQLQLFLFQEHGFWVNHKKVLPLMQELGIRSKIRRKHRCNYAASTGGLVAENVLKREFYAELPNQKWSPMSRNTPYRILGCTCLRSRICITTRLLPITWGFEMTISLFYRLLRKH
ncbi:IS3 family transposase [Paenibacillus sp. 2TAB19]|uniref:IS3 family transposase n=1 Tax=Paenibacillus sp. 2TAB19 TaxID=3233003 RepID=UPI003F949E68